MTIKLEVGKFYRTQDGRKVGPMRNGLGIPRFPWDGFGSMQFYSADGRADDGRSYDLIAEWTDTPAETDIDLTAITTPFGLLDAATQDALRAHGGPYELWIGDEWGVISPDWCGESTYRVKPAPKRETVKQDMGMSSDGGIADFSHGHSTPVRITFDRVDGQIDLSTYRVEAR